MCNKQKKSNSIKSYEYRLKAKQVEKLMNFLEENNLITFVNQEKLYLL